MQSKSASNSDMTSPVSQLENPVKFLVVVHIKTSGQKLDPPPPLGLVVLIPYEQPGDLVILLKWLCFLLSNFSNFLFWTVVTATVVPLSDDPSDEQFPDPFIWPSLSGTRGSRIRWGLLYCTVGCHGSVVACATYKREIAGLIPSWGELCPDIVLLGRHCPHVQSLDPGVSGYLVGQWRCACLNSFVCRKWQPGCMLPRELRWLTNEQVLWPGGNCVKSGKWR